MSKLGPVYLRYLEESRPHHRRKWEPVFPQFVETEIACIECKSNLPETIDNAWRVPNVLPLVVLQRLLDTFWRIDINKTGKISVIEVSSQQKFAVRCSAQNALEDARWLFAIVTLDDTMDMDWNTFCLFWNIIAINCNTLEYVWMWINENEQLKKRIDFSSFLTAPSPLHSRKPFGIRDWVPS